MERRQLWAIAAFLVSASLASAQLDSNSITISASRRSNLQPDQVNFSVGVHSDLNASLDEVAGALQGTGIKASSLVGLYGTGPSLLPITSAQPGIDWIFSLVVPLERIQPTTALLTSLGQSIAQKKDGFSLDFNVQGAQVSPRLQKPDQCSTSDLVSDALAQARKLAEAGGVFVGPIIALSDGSTLPGGFYSANFGFGQGFRQEAADSIPVGSFSYLPYPPALYCLSPSSSNCSAINEGLHGLICGRYED